MKIHVTAEDIAAGYRNSATFCPIANAFRRTLGVDVSVCPTLGWRVGRTGEFMPLSIAAALAAAVFDGTGRMTPFSFELEVSNV